MIVLPVVGLMLNFIVRYHHGSSASRAHRVHATWRYEIAWTTATLLAFLVLFVFGADYYIWLYKSPPADIEMFVVGKQWMWKVQHPGGQREIDEVHVPVGKTVRLVLASQDVVHSFFVPAFRIKRDAVPGTYETVWFKATKTGAYRLECSEFCGTEHVKMHGDDRRHGAGRLCRLAGDERGPTNRWRSRASSCFAQYGCSGCHFREQHRARAARSSGFTAGSCI